MLFLYEALFALVVGLVLTLVFIGLFRSRGPWPIWWAFLLVVFLGAWAGGIWLAPIGPVLFDVYWLPILLAGLVFALLLAAATPPRRVRQPSREMAQPAPTSEDPALSVFFWILLAGLLLVIILAYA